MTEYFKALSFGNTIVPLRVRASLPAHMEKVLGRKKWSNNILAVKLKVSSWRPIRLDSLYPLLPVVTRSACAAGGGGGGAAAQWAQESRGGPLHPGVYLV